MEKSTEEKIQQLQMIEQGMQNFLAQKQQLQSQLIEIESAIKELGTSETAFKIVGNIMVSAKKEDLLKDLNSKKELIELRIKSVEKQESKMKEKASAMQSEVMEKLNPKK
ncbi:prefoldin subunit beta [Candidatus Woesearchaeota archaeon]|nr:prefoldin subunit beta [Candidatus Woesearchaeota archaeon]